MNSTIKEASVDFEAKLREALLEYDVINKNELSDARILTAENFWKLFVKSTTILRNQSEQQDQEMKTIQEYVKQIKSLSDERDKLTDEFEEQNSILKEQLNFLKNKAKLEEEETGKMLSEEGLDQIGFQTITQQIAHLLLSRSSLIKELEEEKERSRSRLHDVMKLRDQLEDFTLQKDESARELKNAKQMIEYLTCELDSVKRREQQQKEAEGEAWLRADEVEMLRNNIERLRDDRDRSDMLHQRRISELEKENDKLSKGTAAQDQKKKVSVAASQYDAQRIMGDLRNLLTFGEEGWKERERQLKEKTLRLEEKIVVLEKQQKQPLHGWTSHNENNEGKEHKQGDLDQETLNLMLCDSEKLVESLKKQKQILEVEVRRALLQLDADDKRESERKSKRESSVERLDHISSSSSQDGKKQQLQIEELMEELCVVRKQWGEVSNKYNRLKQKHKKKVRKMRRSVELERERRERDVTRLSKEADVARLALKAELSWKERASDLIRKSEHDRRNTIAKLNQLDQLFNQSEKKLYENELKTDLMERNNSLLQENLGRMMQENEKLRRKLLSRSKENNGDSALELTGDSIDLSIRASLTSGGGDHVIAGKSSPDVAVEFEEEEDDEEEKAKASGQQFCSYLRLTPDVITSPR